MTNTEARQSCENNQHLEPNIFTVVAGKVSTSEDMTTTNNDCEQNMRLFAGVQFYVEISQGLNKEEAERVSGAPRGLSDHH